MSLEEAGHYPVEKFLIAFALILVSAKIFGALAERFKQPAVLGELVAGVILGGSVLALIPSSDGMAGFQTSVSGGRAPRARSRRRSSSLVGPCDVPSFAKYQLDVMCLKPFDLRH